MSDEARAPLIGLVGCGRWGRLILRDLRLLGCEVAVATRGNASGAAASAAGAVVVVRDVDNLPDVDGVIVAVPTSSTPPSRCGLCSAAHPSSSRSH